LGLPVRAASQREICQTVHEAATDTLLETAALRGNLATRRLAALARQHDQLLADVHNKEASGLSRRHLSEVCQPLDAGPLRASVDPPKPARLAAGQVIHDGHEAAGKLKIR
jgi:hypothetical protein